MQNGHALLGVYRFGVYTCDIFYQFIYLVYSYTLYRIYCTIPSLICR